MDRISQKKKYKTQPSDTFVKPCMVSYKSLVRVNLLYYGAQLEAANIDLQFSVITKIYNLKVTLYYTGNIIRFTI